MDSCLSDSTLDQLRAEELPIVLAEAARSHLRSCRSCAERDRHLAQQREGLLGSLRRAVRDNTLTIAAPEARRGGGRADSEELTRAAPPRLTPSGSPEASTLVSPDQIPGYLIVREIQAGGQGVVYEATQKSTKKRVAIKVVREGPFADPVNRARLERGMRILAQIDHPNIVGILDSGTVGGTFYYVMDYIEGQSLDDYAARLSSSDIGKSRSSLKKQRLSKESLLRLFVKICDVAHAAHLRGVVHRDLKPGNIRIDEQGEPHLLDFDLAKLVQGDIEEESSHLAKTMTGQFLGSLPWASPEQAEGIPSKIDIRTDVYSLGVILYQLLTGRFPYEVVGNLRDILDSILRTEPAKPSSIQRYINDELETIVLKCLAKERDRRYQSAGALADDLRRYLSGDPILAKRASAWYVLRKLARRHAYATALLLLATCTIISSAFISFYFYRAENAEALRNEALAKEALNQARQFETLAVSSQAQLHRMALGWFLLEWHADRLHRARQLRDQTPNDSVEYKAMQFLLDSTVAEERFLANLSAGESPLGYLVIGERHFKANRPAEAVKAYEACLALPCDSWLEATARARLEQLKKAANPRNAPAGLSDGRHD